MIFPPAVGLENRIGGFSVGHLPIDQALLPSSVNVRKTRSWQQQKNKYKKLLQKKTLA
jgi:hypothetical protein